MSTKKSTKTAAKATDWAKPTTFIQRLGDAMQILCAGKRPTDASLNDWLNPELDSFALQEFAIEHGPAWAQGIVLIDAARLLAESPAQGADHEERPSDPRDAEIERLRSLLDINKAGQSHLCKRCSFAYTPAGEGSEDCPACGFDGAGS